MTQPYPTWVILELHQQNCWCKSKQNHLVVNAFPQAREETLPYSEETSESEEMQHVIWWRSCTHKNSTMKMNMLQWTCYYENRYLYVYQLDNKLQVKSTH